MATRQKSNNSRKVGARAKKAAKRKWDKRKEVIFGASISAAGYVVGHLIEAALHPFAVSAFELIYHSKFAHGVAPRDAFPPCDSPLLESDPEFQKLRSALPKDLEADLQALKGPVREALVARSVQLGPFLQQHEDDYLERMLISLLSKWDFMRAPGLREKALLFEKTLNAKFEYEWVRCQMPQDPPVFKIVI